MKPTHSLLVISALFASAAVSQAATVFATLNSQDRIVGDRQVNAVALGYYPDSSILNVGVPGGFETRTVENTVIGFTLPTLNPGESITDATFRITVASINNSGGTFTVALFGLATTNPNASGTTLFSESGTASPGVSTLIDAAFSNNSVAASTVENANVLAFINSLYTGNVPNQTEVFFRMNPTSDLVVTGGTLRETFSNGTAQLELNVIPEPGAALLGSLGLLALLRRRRN